MPIKQSLGTTMAFQLLVTAVFQIREERNLLDQRIIRPELSESDAIAALLVYAIVRDYEQRFSPRTMSSLLLNYARDDIAQSFIDIFSAREPSLTRELLSDRRFDAVVDFPSFAQQGRALGWKKSWNIFKPPFDQQWNQAFR